MTVRKLLPATAIFALCSSTAAADDAPDPYRFWPGITIAHEVAPGPAPPQNSAGFSASGEGDTFLQAEATKPDNTTTKGTVYNETNLYGHLNWSDWFTLNGAVKYEHQRFNNLEDYYPDRTSFMRSEGLTLRQLYATLRPDGTEDFSLYAGKIHPHFGTAWSYNGGPGIFYNFGTDYEQDEMIGFGADVEIPSTPATSWLGTAHLSAETFFLDTTALSYSLLGHPPATDMFVDRPGMFALSQGSAANTNNFDSVTTALQGHDLLGTSGLAYQLSFTHEGVRLPGEKAQTGATAAAAYTFTLDDNFTTAPFGEYAWIDNFNGQDGLTRNYGVIGLATIRGKWELDFVGGLRNSDDHIANRDVWDYQSNVSLLYQPIDKLWLGGGFNHARINDVGSNTVGLMALYQFTL